MSSGTKGMPDGSEFSWRGRETSPQLSSYQVSTLSHGIGKLENCAFHDTDMTLDFDFSPYLSLTDPWTTPSLTDQQAPNEIITPPEQTIRTSAEQSTNAAAPASPHDPKQTRDCEALAFGVLRSLHDHSSIICKGPHGAANLAKPMPSIDRILFANKAALTSLIPLLQCPCARSPHIALLHSAILSKTIFWYHVAVTAWCRAEGAGSRHMRIQLGVLELDDDDQAALQSAVLLRELCKAEKATETLNACSSGEDEGPKWHSAVIQNMQEELQTI
ncbi:hypothetical protein CEP54_016292 [Fusarium duplospermum]|uniref:Aflatoxin regulatory protein domain-containing protein n=1 Tax=Fusarium duplospermum TaxID=1325734 RepID=A0A428NFN1_9HYPO|nr:hypothetical protein CEP54_016292 [Fusarium duplospermum]